MDWLIASQQRLPRVVVGCWGTPLGFCMTDTKSIGLAGAMAFAALASLMVVPSAAAHECNSADPQRDCGPCPPPAAHYHADTDYDPEDPSSRNTGCSSDACDVTDLVCWFDGVRHAVNQILGPINP